SGPHRPGQLKPANRLKALTGCAHTPWGFPAGCCHAWGGVVPCPGFLRIAPRAVMKRSAGEPGGGRSDVVNLAYELRIARVLKVAYRVLGSSPAAEDP